MNKRIAAAQAARAASEAKRKACLIPFTEEEWHLWDENCEEEYVVPLIKKYLRTPGQASALYSMDATIEDCLNGRVAGGASWQVITHMFEDWNKKLGYHRFGF